MIKILGDEKVVYFIFAWNLSIIWFICASHASRCRDTEINKKKLWSMDTKVSLNVSRGGLEEKMSDFPELSVCSLAY